MKIKNWQGLTVYITGGSSGIGLATARLLASRGSNVIIFSRSTEVLQAAVAEIAANRASDTQRVSYATLDVSQREMAVKVLADCVSQFGPPDVLINSAGISYPRKFEQTPFDKFDDIMKVNLYGTWNAVDILLPYLKERKGYIINVSSVAGLVGIIGMTAYSASKFGVIGFSEALRSELKPYGVTVSVLCPPDVRTPMLERANLIKPEEAKALSGTAAIMEPEEVATALVCSMAKGEFLIIPNCEARLTAALKRLFPWLAQWIIDRKIKQTQS